ncbi:hypothetical protein JCM10212_006391 [Sporobolomyces blumeae]
MTRPQGVNQPEDIHDDVHAKRDQHEAAERQADALARERKIDERVHPNQHGTPAQTHPTSDLSSFPHRESLDDAAHHSHPTASANETHPDMQGVTHIPESELPPRHYRLEDTALRPSDPNDPNSMNGKANYAVAGDDRTL